MQLQLKEVHGRIPVLQLTHLDTLLMQKHDKLREMLMHINAKAEQYKGEIKQAVFMKEQFGGAKNDEAKSKTGGKSASNQKKQYRLVSTTDGRDIKDDLDDILN